MDATDAENRAPGEAARSEDGGLPCVPKRSHAGAGQLLAKAQFVAEQAQAPEGSASGDQVLLSQAEKNILAQVLQQMGRREQDYSAAMRSVSAKNEALNAELLASIARTARAATNEAWEKDFATRWWLREDASFLKTAGQDSQKRVYTTPTEEARKLDYKEAWGQDLSEKTVAHKELAQTFLSRVTTASVRGMTLKTLDRNFSAQEDVAEDERISASTILHGLQVYGAEAMMPLGKLNTVLSMVNASLQNQKPLRTLLVCFAKNGKEKDAIAGAIRQVTHGVDSGLKNYRTEMVRAVPSYWLSARSDEGGLLPAEVAGGSAADFRALVASSGERLFEKLLVDLVKADEAYTKALARKERFPLAEGVKATAEQFLRSAPSHSKRYNEFELRFSSWTRTWLILTEARRTKSSKRSLASSWQGASFGTREGWARGCGSRTSRRQSSTTFCLTPRATSTAARAQRGGRRRRAVCCLSRPPRGVSPTSCMFTTAKLTHSPASSATVRSSPGGPRRARTTRPCLAGVAPMRAGSRATTNGRSKGRSSRSRLCAGSSYRRCVLLAKRQCKSSKKFRTTTTRKRSSGRA